MARNPFDVVMEDRKKLVDRIIENMEKGELSWNKNWNAGALQPQNPVSNVKYQGVNKLKLMMTAIEKDYKDPRWVTFKQAFDNGWKIKKGEKAVLCEKWIFTKKEIEIDEQGNKIEKEVKLDKPIPNFFYVFNGEQIEKIPELKLQNELEKSEITEIAQDFINSSECKIKEIAQDRAFYNPSTDEIILPLRESFKSEQDFLATTLHEMVHSTGHKDRLDRDLSGTFGSEKYAKEELTAELGAMFLQSKLGIKIEGEHFDNHSAYLKSWIETLKKDPNELFRAANNADKATEMLYGKYIEKQQEELKELSNISIKAEPMDFLRVNLKYSELDKIGDFKLENKIYRGAEAYKLLDNLAKFDKKHSIDREKRENVHGYYKTYLEINTKGYSTGEIRIDLGDREFGGLDKVSNALEYRLKSFPEEILAHKKEYAQLKNISIQEIETEAKKIEEQIDKSMNFFKEKEKLYLENEKIKEKELVESIKKEIKENSLITKEELSKKINIPEDKVKEEIGKMIKNKEIFYIKENDNTKYFIDKIDYVKEVKEAEVRKEAAIENRKKELERIIKEVTEKEIPRGNYNCFSGNEIVMPNHKSNDKRWIRVEDVEKKNIKVNENERPMLTVLTGKNERGNLKVTTVEFYNVSQLEITKEIEQKFVPMKQKEQEKRVEKSKDKGVGIGD